MLQLAHVPINIIYNTRLLKRCQHMTVTYVVVTLAVVLAAVLPDCFRLSDPNKDHNSFVLQYSYLLLPVTSIPKVLHDLIYGTLLHALDEYLNPTQPYT